MSPPFLPCLTVCVGCRPHIQHKVFRASCTHKPTPCWNMAPLGEVEVVFGFWGMVLTACMLLMVGKSTTLEYLESRTFTEPLFVFAIMVVAGTRTILQACGLLIQQVARLAPLPTAMGNYFLLLSVVPLLGSFITEPAAMTLAALMLRDSVFSFTVSERLKYATLGGHCCRRSHRGRPHRHCKCSKPCGGCHPERSI